MIRFILILISMLALGCASIAKNPAVFANNVETAANVANDAAKTLFMELLPNLAPTQRDSAQAAFDKAEAVYSNALVALNNALAAYQDGTEADWGKLIVDVQHAVAAVVDVVDTFSSPKAGYGLGGSSPTLGARFVAQRSVLSQDVVTVERYRAP